MSNQKRELHLKVITNSDFTLVSLTDCYNASVLLMFFLMTCSHIAKIASKSLT
jgi:hypothetical protein